LTEFDILKASHKFLRDEEGNAESERKAKSWNDQLAEKYYANLYREFAVCDLKHYKSGNVRSRLGAPTYSDDYMNSLRYAGGRRTK